MKALLLAAGLGTRLRPLTDFLPKCLAPVGERPLLEYWLATLFDSGIEEVLLNTHYLSELVETYVAGSPWSNRTVLAYEPELLGTAGTIRRHAKFIGDSTFLLAHADNLSLFNPAELFHRHAHRPGGTIMTMMTFETSDPKSCGIVSLDPAGIVTEFFEKVSDPPGTLANAAVYMLEPEVVELISGLSSRHPDFSTEVIPRLVGRIFTYQNNKYHVDIGTVSAWREAQVSYPSLRGNPGFPNDSWPGILDRDNKRIRRVLDEIRVQVR